MTTLKNPKILPEGNDLWLVDAPEMPKVPEKPFDFEEGIIEKYYESLSKAPRWKIKNGEEVNKALYDIESPSWMPCKYIHKDWRLEQGRLYDVPEGYSIRLRYNHEHKECQIECICTNDEMHAILIPEEEMKEESQELINKTASMIENFTKGYLSCIKDLREWNDNTGKPDISLHNRLMTIENKIKQKESDLLR